MDLLWIPVTKHWRLNERHYGALQGLNKAETAAKHGEAQVKIWRRSYDIPPPPLTRRRSSAIRGSDPRYARSRSRRDSRSTESLKDTVARFLPYWHETIAPAIARRSARAHRRARQQPARAREVPRRRQRAGDRRAEHPDGHPARLRARRSAASRSATTTLATRRRRRRPRRGGRTSKQTSPARTCPHTRLRRRHRRRRPRRADPRATAAAGSAGAAGVRRREPHASGARGGVQGRRIERRDWRALLPHASSASSRTCASGSSRSSACATSFRRRTIARSRTRFELGPTVLPAGAVVSARSRPPRELAAGDGPRRAASTSSTTARVTGVELGAAAPPRQSPTGAARERSTAAGSSTRAAAPACCGGSSGSTRRVGHGANACWFRFPHRLKIDDWSDDPVWRARVPTGQRWLSTNHLMGAGYWVWLIPLGSGSTSVGIVADDDAASVRR